MKVFDNGLRPAFLHQSEHTNHFVYITISGVSAPATTSQAAAIRSTSLTLEHITQT